MKCKGCEVKITECACGDRQVHRPDNPLAPIVSNWCQKCWDLGKGVLRG